MKPHAPTYYAVSANPVPSFPTLKGEVQVDVAIIGGGFTGVSTALELAEKGYRVAVLEANRIGWGATGRNGGQVTGSLSGDTAMARQFRNTIGKQADEFVWNLRWRGHDIIRQRVERYRIACDLKFGHMQTALKPAHMDELQATFEVGQRRGMGEQLQLVPADRMGDYLETDLYCGGLLNRKNMHLHPLNLCLGEAMAAHSLGALMFEDSRVLEIEHASHPLVRTAHGQVRADAVLLAGNAYHHLERKKLARRMFPASLANMATVPLERATATRINPQDLAVYDSRFVLDYYRLTADNRLLFGGGTSYSGHNLRQVAAQLRPAMERTFPRLKGVAIQYQWTGLDGIVLNRIPLLGKLSHNVYYAQGYSGHGIALSHIVGEIMARAIRGEMEQFDVFDRVRHVSLPLPGSWGSQIVALGMFYYRLRELLR